LSAVQEIDSELTVIIRKFTKKDTTTRLKAATELQARIEADPEEEVVKVIPKWVRDSPSFCPER